MKTTITPTAHEKAEWARLAQAAYAADLNTVGHRFSGAASLRNEHKMMLATFDSLQNDYRTWLVDGIEGLR